jgi:hypothetical protein
MLVARTSRVLEGEEVAGMTCHLGPNPIHWAIVVCYRNHSGGKRSHQVADVNKSGWSIGLHSSPPPLACSSLYCFCRRQLGTKIDPIRRPYEDIAFLVLVG